MGERRSEGRERERLTMSCMCVCVNFRSGTVSISPILKWQVLDTLYIVIPILSPSLSTNTHALFENTEYINRIENKITYTGTLSSVLIQAVTPPINTSLLGSLLPNSLKFFTDRVLFPLKVFPSHLFWSSKEVYSFDNLLGFRFPLAAIRRLKDCKKLFKELSFCLGVGQLGSNLQACSKWCNAVVYCSS